MYFLLDITPHLGKIKTMKHIHKKNIHMKRVESDLNEPLEEALRRRFVDENMQIMDIANEFNIAYSVIIKWLPLCGIYTRKLRI